MSRYCPTCDKVTDTVESRDGAWCVGCGDMRDDEDRVQRKPDVRRHVDRTDREERIRHGRFAESRRMRE